MVKVGAYVLYINVIVSTSSFFCSYCSKYDMRRRQVKEDPPKKTSWMDLPLSRILVHY